MFSFYNFVMFKCVLKILEAYFFINIHVFFFGYLNYNFGKLCCDSNLRSLKFIIDCRVSALTYLRLKLCWVVNFELCSKCELNRQTSIHNIKFYYKLVSKYLVETICDQIRVYEIWWHKLTK